MNCPFCNKQGTANPPHSTDMNMLICLSCSNEKLTVEFCPLSEKLHWVAFVSDLYCVEISYIDGMTRFFKNVTDEPEAIVLKVQNIMNIRPDNFFEIIEKLDRWLPLR